MSRMADLRLRVRADAGATAFLNTRISPRG